MTRGDRVLGYASAALGRDEAAHALQGWEGGPANEPVCLRVLLVASRWLVETFLRGLCAGSRLVELRAAERPSRR